MSIKFPEIKAFDTAQFEALTKAADSSTKGLQAIAAETTDYSKKSFEKTRELCEKLVGVKKIEEAIKLQADFAKSTYEDFVAQATKTVSYTHLNLGRPGKISMATASRSMTDTSGSFSTS